MAFDTRTKCDICEKRRKCDVSYPRENHGNLQKDNWKTVKFAICSECHADR